MFGCFGVFPSRRALGWLGLYLFHFYLFISGCFLATYLSAEVLPGSGRSTEAHPLGTCFPKGWLRMGGESYFSLFFLIIFFFYFDIEPV